MELHKYAILKEEIDDDFLEKRINEKEWHKRRKELLIKLMNASPKPQKWN